MSYGFLPVEVPFSFGYNAVKLLGTCLDFVGPALKARYAFVILATVFGGRTVAAAVLAAFISLPPRLRDC